MTATFPYGSHPRSLRELTDHLISVFANRAGFKGSFIVNEIPGDLVLNSDRQLITSVLTGLLSAIINHSSNSCIRLTARVFGSIVLFKVKDSNSDDVYEVESAVEKFKALAGSMRGSVYVTNQHKQSTTVTFGFSNPA